MHRKRQRELVVGAMAIVLVAVAAWSLTPRSPQPSPNAAPNVSANAHARPNTSIVVVDLKALEADRPEPQESRRNPFRFKPKAALPPPPTAAQIKQKQQAAEMAARGPVEPPLPRIPLKYIGDMSDPNNPGKRIAILSDARSTYYGREGEIVEGRYRIMRIGVESVELAYLDGRGRQTIRQTGQ